MTQFNHPEGVRAIMDEEKCDVVKPNGVKEKKLEVIDGYTIKYHANGKTMWSKGKIIDGEPEGYWEWYRTDGTLKRSGHFEKGEPVGEWITYDSKGVTYKVTNRDK
ncbi:toxin-antitoxin system YwqK family antitoxin [Planococcus sp. CP5-4_YE]|uniref:toxin-antitoxin system YwqK family antitoxin n=2 Tax=Planococcus TaxID=1372 RepID=UPI00349F19E2